MSVVLVFGVLVYLSGSGSMSVAASPTATGRPNLIVIMADDLGAKELGCYGHPTHQTPHLDAMARDGIHFATCYAACICHPTRFEIMTGQYGCTNGVYQFAGRPGGPQPDAREEQIVNHVTFGKMLKQAGYATAVAGKWQLSGEHPTLVRENGFDEYCIWAYKHNLPKGVVHTGGWESERTQKTSRYWHPSIVKNGQYVPTTIDDYGPDIFCNFVIDFALRHRDQPFFIYYPMTLTHDPFYSTPTTNPDAKEKFRHSKQEKFAENVEYMDRIVGRILAQLKTSGLDHNTIVFFTADNGTGGEGKATPTERGARVPMIVRGASVKPQGVSDALVDLSDVFPTLLEFSGATIPESHRLDGRSFAPILRGTQSKTRNWIFSYLGDRRVLRTERYLLENNSPTEFGTLYDCGDSRDGSGYQNVTRSDSPEVSDVKARFLRILASKPTPTR